MKIVVSIVSFVAAFIGVQYAIDYSRELEVRNQIEQEFESIRRRAIGNGAGEDSLLSLKEIAISRSEERINSIIGQEEREKFAAGTFIGFYLVNVRERSKYCKELGIDITPFIDEFKKIHKEEYEASLRILSFDDSDIEQMYDLMSDQLNKVIDQDMRYISKKNSVSIPQACQLVSDNWFSLVPKMHLSLVHPTAYEVLMVSEKMFSNKSN